MTAIALIVDQASGSSSMAEHVEQGAGWPWTSPHTIGSATQENNEGWQTGEIMAGEVRVWVNLRCCEQVLI